MGVPNEKLLLYFLRLLKKKNPFHLVMFVEVAEFFKMVNVVNL